MLHHLLHRKHGENQNSIANMFGQTRHGSLIYLYTPKLLEKVFKMNREDVS